MVCELVYVVCRSSAVPANLIRTSGDWWVVSGGGVPNENLLGVNGTSSPAYRTRYSFSACDST